MLKRLQTIKHDNTKKDTTNLCLSDEFYDSCADNAANGHVKLLERFYSRGHATKLYCLCQ